MKKWCIFGNDQWQEKYEFDKEQKLPGALSRLWPGRCAYNTGAFYHVTSRGNERKDDKNNQLDGENILKAEKDKKLGKMFERMETSIFL